MVLMAQSTLAQEVRYIYDPLGRLIGVVDQQGKTAIYEYDAVGNLLAIRRLDAAGPVAITFSNPNIGPVGRQVEIVGIGFSATASENAIAFNGVPASVLAASPNVLTTQVPNGATTGPVTVTTPSGSATSAEPFTVLKISVAPTQARLLFGTTQQFTATISGTADQRLIWGINGIEGGSASVGTITTQGLYTAPGGIPVPPTVTVRATSLRFPDLFAETQVTILNLLSLPTSLTLGLGQTSTMPITLANPAPPGGVIVALTSDNPAVVEVLTPSVSIPAGSRLGSGQIRGATPGTANVTASNPDAISSASAVTVTANLDILQSSAILFAGFPPVSINIQLEVSGSPVAAPAAIEVTVTPANPTCVSVTSPVTISTGLVSTTAQLTPGTAVLPCTTVLTASAPNITQDTINVTVNPQPSLTLNGFPRTVGAGLQVVCCSVSLGAPAPTGGGDGASGEQRSDEGSAVPQCHHSGDRQLRFGGGRGTE